MCTAQENLVQTHGALLRVGLVLEGICNKCGVCCVGIHEGEQVFCENLEILGELGSPDATMCRIHASRVLNTPIWMLNSVGERVFETICAKDNELETRTILEKGIGRGCSLGVRLICPQIS